MEIWVWWWNELLAVGVTDEEWLDGHGDGCVGVWRLGEWWDEGGHAHRFHVREKIENKQMGYEWWNGWWKVVREMGLMGIERWRYGCGNRINCYQWAPMACPRIEISVFMDISVLRFYGYIGNIGEISVDIFSQISIESKLFKINRNTWKNFKKW